MLTIIGCARAACQRIAEIAAGEMFKLVANGRPRWAGQVPARAAFRDGDQVSAGDSADEAGPLSAVPSGANCEPWHGQSQHCSVEFQCTTQPICVQLAERTCRRPSLSRHAATLLMPLRKTRPSPGLSDSADEMPLAVRYSAK